MGTRCLNWPQPSISHSSSSSPQTLASAISSPSTRRRSFTEVTLVFRYVHRPAIFGAKLHRFHSCEIPKVSTKKHPIKRASTAGLDSEFSDEEFSKEIHWPEVMIPASIERKANSVDLPFSLRIIKKKKQLEEGFKEAEEFAYCSVKKAFSSMVFIIRELQSYSLQMREILFYEDLQAILSRVQKEMNASFVWLFQQVFSHTPTLMMYVMILLANYSVHSMSSTVAPLPAGVEYVSSFEDQGETQFDSSSVKTFLVDSGGKVTSVGGINGGGGKFRRVASATDGGERFDGSVDYNRGVVDPTRGSEESVSGRVTLEEERVLWDLMVHEADTMRDLTGDGGVDREIMRGLVAPVTAEIGEVGGEDHFKTELLYQTVLAQEPDNPLLLANYAQFLYLFVRDYDRAENYFKRACKVEAKDAEALSKYASFLWHVKDDIWSAEEVFLEAISSDPNNSFYTANYAHFLWRTGAEDTCFPLDPPEKEIK